MRWMQITAFFLVAALGAFSAGNSRDSSMSDRRAILLTGKLEILSQRYCRSATNDYVRVECKVQFTNAGQEPLILWRKSGDLVGMKVIKERPEPGSKPFVVIVDQEIDYVGESGRIRSSSTPSSDEFVILKRGESFKTESSFQLSQPRGETRFNLYYGPGKYVITIGINTWTNSYDLGRTLQERWRKWGLLWYSGLSSEPLTVILEETPNIEDCSQ